MTDKDQCPVVEYTPEFKRNLSLLAKKYRNIHSDIEPIIKQIKSGDFIGSLIPKTGDYDIFKVRVKNSDINKGKSSGYRIIYYVENKTDEYYSRPDKTDIRWL
ncbi:MAG: type II toxin-antitoxin system RelE/ParE family toxin [Deltaproteobacteria bacterium]|nr:type II toxin-antitoxin system RelE/ParE family toxin [Deltaproteobacteria bacterium]